MMTSKLKTIAVCMFFTAAIPAQASFKTFKTYLAYPWAGTFNIPSDTRSHIESDYKAGSIDQTLEDDIVGSAKKAMQEGKVLTLATHKLVTECIGMPVKSTASMYSYSIPNPLHDRVHELITKHEENVNKAAIKTSVSLAAVIATVTCVAAYKYRKQIAEKLKTLKQRFVKSASIKA